MKQMKRMQGATDEIKSVKSVKFDDFQNSYHLFHLMTKNKKALLSSRTAGHSGKFEVFPRLNKIIEYKKIVQWLRVFLLFARLHQCPLLTFFLRYAMKAAEPSGTEAATEASLVTVPCASG